MCSSMQSGRLGLRSAAMQQIHNPLVGDGRKGGQDLTGFTSAVHGMNARRAYALIFSQQVRVPHSGSD